jgi:hypothetical protein
VTVAAAEPRFAGRSFWEAVATQGVDVEIVVMMPPDSRRERLRLDDHLVETRVPMRPAHAAVLERWFEREGAIPALALALHHRHTPEYGEELSRSGAGAAAVVAAGSLAAPALLRHTRAPLIVDARSLESDPTRSPAQFMATIEPIERRACRTAALVRACSPRHAHALQSRFELTDDRVLTIPDGAPMAVRFVPFEVRRHRCAGLGLDRHPIVLASALARPRGFRASAALADLQRALPGVRVIRETGGRDLLALLAVANAAIILDDGPGARGDLVMLGQAGVPLLAEKGPLEDAGLQAGPHATELEVAGGVAEAVRDALAADHTEQVLAARDALADYSEEDAAEAFLSDGRVADLLQWNRPMVRRPRPRVVVHAS